MPAKKGSARRLVEILSNAMPRDSPRNRGELAAHTARRHAIALKQRLPRDRGALPVLRNVFEV